MGSEMCIRDSIIFRPTAPTNKALPVMDTELIDRSTSIRQRVTKLRDSL